MAQRLDAVAGIGRLISGRPPEDFDWTDPRLLGWSDLVATAVWPALDGGTRASQADALEGFAVAHALNSDRNAQILTQLERVAECLHAVGIEPIVMKGAAHLATGLWPTLGSRLVADIDLLVAADQMEPAFSALEALAGLGAQDRGDPEVTAETKHMAPVVGAGGPAPVEIHHTVFAETARTLVPFEALHAQSVRVPLGAGHVRVAAPTDRVMHAMLHGPAGSGTYRAPRLHMRDLLDIHFLDRRYGDEIAWDRIEGHLTAEGWAGALEITNQCLSRFVGMDPPFRRGGLRARLDAARWSWQLEHPGSRQLGNAANMLSHTVWSLSSGGSPRRRALDYLRQPDTYRRAFRRYVLGRPK